MDRYRVLILYSNRLFAEGMESLLRRETCLEIVGMEASDRPIPAVIRSLQPDVVVLDAHERWGCVGSVIPAILEANPNVRVVCLSMADNNIDVYHKHQITATRREDLVGAIQMA